MCRWGKKRFFIWLAKFSAKAFFLTCKFSLKYCCSISCLIESLNKGKGFEGKVQGNEGCFFDIENLS